MTSSRGSATAIGFIAVLLWATLAPLTAATGTIPPFELAALTFAVGGGIGLAYAAMRGKLGLLRQPLPVWIHGVGGLFGYHALYFAAVRRAPVAEASLIAYLWPLLIVLFSAALPGERLRLRHVIGALMGFGGAALLFLSKGGGFAEVDHYALGYALALGCAFVWSGYSVSGRLLGDAPSEAVAGFCLATAAAAAIAHFAFETTAAPAGLGAWLAVLALGIGPVGLAFYVWDYGVKRGDIKLLGVSAYAAPVLSTLLLVTLGFAPATWWLAAACAAIVGGAVVASRPG